MNDNQLELILARAFSDSAFRQSLLTNPQQALTGYNLSPEELTVLQEALQGDAPTESNETQPIEDRKSTWVINTLGVGKPGI